MLLGPVSNWHTTKHALVPTPAGTIRTSTEAPPCRCPQPTASSSSRAAPSGCQTAGGQLRRLRASAVCMGALPAKRPVSVNGLLRCAGMSDGPFKASCRDPLRGDTTVPCPSLQRLPRDTGAQGHRARADPALPAAALPAARGRETGWCALLLASLGSGGGGTSRAVVKAPDSGLAGSQGQWGSTLSGAFMLLPCCLLLCRQPPVGQ